MRGEVWEAMSSFVLNLNRYHFLSLFLLLIVLNPVFINAEDKLCDKVTDLKVDGLYSIPKEEFYSLIDVKEGQSVGKKDITRTVKRLFQKGIYDDIIVSISEKSDSNCVIVFKIIEKKIIKSINIENNNFITKSFIKKQLLFETGERVNHRNIELSIKNIQKAINQQGFANPIVTYKIIEKDIHNVELVIDIQEGTPIIIKKIILNDSSGLIDNFLTISEGDLYDRVAIQKMEQRIREYLIKNLFVSSTFSYSFDEGVLVIDFNRGKQLTISLIGNEKLSRDVIIKEIPTIELKEITDEVVEEFKKRIVNLYHSKGYPNISIIPAISSGEDFIDLQFFIYEGERYTVEDILFEGNSISEKRLKELLNLRKDNPYNPNFINTDIETLKEFYQSLGYLNVSIDQPEVAINDDRILIKFKINEKDVKIIKSISFIGNNLVTTERLQGEIPIKIEGPLNEIDLAESRRKILEVYRKMGFDNVQVVIKKDIQDVATIIFEINEGNPILFGKTLFRGQIKTKYWVFNRERLHKERDIFQRSIILKERQQLYRTGLFSDIHVDFSEPYKVDEGVDSLFYRDVIFTVKEAPAGAVEFGVGYGEYEQYRGFVEVSYKNLWGLNRQGSFRTEVSSIEQRIILTYYDPWFFRESLPLKGLLLHEKKEERSLGSRDVRYRLKRTTASLGVEKKTSDNLNIEFFYDFSVVNTYDVQPDIVLSKEDTGTLIISALRPGLIYDTRDSPFDPTAGILAGINAKFASFLLFSETDFAKMSFYLNNYNSLLKGIVLATSLRGGLAKGFRNTRELPLVERFFLGGRTTVRGYEQDRLGPKGSDGNPTGGNLFAMGNIELRADVGKGIGIVSFLDFGNVWQRSDQISSLKYTTGLGLRYNTPVGPIRVDYGFKLNKDKGDSKGALHFSLGHAF